MENNINKNEDILGSSPIINDEYKENLCQLKVFVNKEFSYIDYHADYKQKCKDELDFTEFSFIHGIGIMNTTKTTYKDLTIKFVFSSSAFSANDIHIKQVNEGEELAIRMSFIKVDKMILDSLTETVPSSLKALLVNNNNEIICEEDYLFNTLPISQPSLNIIEDPRLYAKYITPLVSYVKQITLNASKILGSPIIAYQNTIKKDILKEIEAIYKALHECGISYQNPPSSGELCQRVRMPEEVLRDKKGTCLDLSLLFCSCLQEVGYHSILLIVDGHALIGVFLDEKNDDKVNFDTAFFKNGIENKHGVINNLNGHNLVFVNSVNFCALNNDSYQSAIDEANDNYIRLYQGHLFIAIDVNTCHEGIFSPIPTSASNGELEQLIDPKLLEKREIDPIIERKYVNVLREEEKDRFTFWEKKLLDLTESNPLINFQMKITNCVKIISENSISSLLENNESLKVELLSNDKMSANYFEEYISRANVKPSDIVTTSLEKNVLYGVGLEKTLKKIIKKSKEATEETGAPTLYLCLGVLTFDRKRFQNKGTAPFLVLPIKKFIKDKMGIYYTIYFDIDDLMINQTFFEYFKLEHPGVDFGELYNVNFSDGYMNIVNTFKSNNTEDIALDETSFFIANLTFSHYIMWNDMRKRKEELKKNLVVQSFIENRNLLDEVSSFEDKQIDEIEKYEDFAAPLPYDSTQLKAILECGEGKSFILDGPPGTGKSQTIVNMIVNAFYHGKTILFVAEKKAALDVVADRLEKIQLGRFCLELHSNKANKNDFYEKLSKSMEKGQTLEPKEFEEKCKELDDKRNLLLKTINLMHNNCYFYSMYDCIVKQEAIESMGIKYFVQFEENYLNLYSNSKNKNIVDLLERYIFASKDIKNFDKSILKYLNIEKLNFNDKHEFINDFKIEKDRIFELLKVFSNVLSTIGFSLDRSINDISNFITATDIYLKKEIYLDKLDIFIQNKDDVLNENIFKISKQINDFKNTKSSRYNFNLIENIDIKTLFLLKALSTNFFKKFLFRIKARKIIRKAMNKTFKYNKNELGTYLVEIKTYFENMEYVKNNSNLLNKMVGFDFIQNMDNLIIIEERYKNTRIFINSILEINKNNTITTLLTGLAKAKLDIGIKIQFDSLYRQFFDLKSFEENVIFPKYMMDLDLFDPNIDQIDKYLMLINYVIDENNYYELISLASLNQLSHKINDLGLKDIIKSLKKGDILVKDLKEVFELSLAKGFIGLYFKNNEEINYFNPQEFEREVDNYKKLISEYSNLAIEDVSAKLSKDLNHNSINYKNSSPIGRLKKIFSMKKGKPAIRDTLMRFDEIIKKYFPCFLMSPLSAAQYLAVENKDGHSVSKFDLVIFDEASQIPTHEAIGPIARGKSLIVAGDPLQMPPSQYFSANIELEGDDIIYEDAYSLLDECIAIEIPRIRLNYHYRSKHESLIGFSNKFFYNNELYTFPSISTLKSEVFFKYVELEKEKENSNISKEEINAICNTFKEIYNNQQTKMKSVGIIVFNIHQKEAVDDAINSLLESDKELSSQVMSAAEKTKEEFFIKSLENVQGDERDIIILSIGFTKSSTGHPIIRGPIAGVNGERRLNVAASRSKEKMILVSTIKSSDFEDDAKLGNKNKGALFLKKFIKFSEMQTYSNSDVKDLDKNSIVTFMKNDLIAKGFNTVANVGNSDYKVDLAIKSKENDKYILGILVDTKEIKDNISCRDKMFLQNSFLSNGLKWKVINIYSIEYFKDPVKTIDKIINSIYKCSEEKFSFDIDPHIESKPKEKFSYDTIEYKKTCHLPTLSYSSRYGFSSALRLFISLIIENEGPVSLETIKEYVREKCFNLKKISSLAESYILHELNDHFKNKTEDRNDKGEYIYFYWPENTNKDLKKFRISGRNINDICKEEIFAAMRQVIIVQEELTIEDLFKATLDAFDYGESVLSGKNRSRLEYVYRWAKTNGRF